MTKMFEGAINKVKPEGLASPSVVPDAYDMSAADYSDLIGMSLSGKPAEAISLAFYFGFVMGNRCTLRRGLKRL